jgi:hypothetical protein
VPADPAPITGTPSASGPGLPSVCHPAVTPPPHQLWLTPQASKAQAVWDAHADDLTEPYVTGKNGWVFWNDVQANNFSQAVGRRTLSNQEAAQWHTYLSDVQAQLAAKKIPFYVVVTPAKWDVYPQELPQWAQDIRGSGPLDQIEHQFPDLPIVDLRTPLREASKSNPVFSKVNSHWTDYGAYVGWETMAKCINDVSPSIGPVSAPASSGVTLGPQSNEFATYGIPNPAKPDWTVPNYSQPLAPVKVTDSAGKTTTVAGTVPTDLSLLPVSTTTKDAQTNKSALVLRDSFGNGMSVFLQQSFAKTWQVRHNFDDPTHIPDVGALVTAHKPDVVILQISERHLNFPPPTSATQNH